MTWNYWDLQLFLQISFQFFDYSNSFDDVNSIDDINSIISINAKDPSKFSPARSLRNEVNAYGALILGLDEERLIAPELYEAMMNNENVIQHYI